LKKELKATMYSKSREMKFRHSAFYGNKDQKPAR
jgi:hypothetical protein